MYEHVLERIRAVRDYPQTKLNTLCLSHATPRRTMDACVGVTKHLRLAVSPRGFMDVSEGGVGRYQVGKLSARNKIAANSIPDPLQGVAQDVVTLCIDLAGDSILELGGLLVVVRNVPTA